MSLKFHLNNILEELQITKNALAVEGKIRPATISKYEKGNVERIEVTTLVSILDTLNRIAVKKGKSPKYDLEDIITYKFNNDE